MKRQLVFLLTLVLVIIDYVNTSCEHIQLAKCACEYPKAKRYHISCQRLGLTSLPPKLNRSLLDGEASGNFSYNGITNIPDAYFKTMNYYDILDFTSNKIKNFGAAALTGLEGKLTNLNLSRNQISSIPTDALKHYIRLNTLDLSGNAIRSPCGIKTADIIYYSLASNGITSLRDGCFSESTNVGELDLSGNNIDFVGPEAFEGMNQLKKLDLGNNDLSDLGDGLSSLVSLSHFESLSLRGNNLQHISSICRHKLANLRYLDLGYNNLIDIQKYCFNTYATTSDSSPDLTINFEHNSVPSLANTIFAGLNDRLTRLRLNHNLIVEVNVNTFTDLKRLVYLNLDNNRIESLEFLRTWEDNTLQELSLANNYLQNLSPKVFEKLTRLIKLTLDGNMLLNIEANAFQGMSLLNDLSIRYNLMTNLADGAFNGLSQLRKLKLTGNGLVTLKNCTFANLDRLVQFHFDDNLLHCDCDLLWLLPYANSVDERGIPEKSVDEPVLRDECHYPESSPEKFYENVVSRSCDTYTLTTNACFGLGVEYDEPIGEQMNVSWSYKTQNSAVEEILLSQVNVETNEMVFDEDVTTSALPVTLKRIEDEQIYKICVSVLFKNENRETDCTVYPKMIRKPTTTMAPTTQAMTPKTGLSSGDVAAICLAVILIILIILIVLFVVYLWKTNRVREMMPRKRYRQQAIPEDSDGRSSSQSPSSNGKHDPLDFRAASEDDPMMIKPAYEEHDL